LHKRYSVERCPIYDAGLVQRLCLEIESSRDEDRTEDLFSVLQAVISENQEELRMRLAYLAAKYADTFSDLNLGDARLS
jgi:hypothetical protein